MTAWQEAQELAASRLGEAVAAAARRGDRRGVQALLDKAGSRRVAAGIVTYAAALTDERFEAFRESSRQFAGESRAARERAAESDIAECVALLAGLMGVSRIAAEKLRNRDDPASRVA